MSKLPIQIDYVGLQSYSDVLEIQEEAFQNLLNEKSGSSDNHAEMKLILCQHNPVYTLGKNGKLENLLPIARNSGAEFIHSSRGGDITFHGPGQLVGYPILDLERIGIGLARYIELLEESIINTISKFGIKGGRYSGASGVWLDANLPGKVRKICAMGIRSSRWVTMHGFALNINTDLNYFDYINPCGFVDKGVTSMQKEFNKKQDFHKIMETYTHEFCRSFNLEEKLNSQKMPHAKV